VVAEMTSADEAFEVVSSGAAVALLTEETPSSTPDLGSLAFRSQELSPALLPVAWRTVDRKPAVASFVQACLESSTDGLKDRIQQSPASR
jgi:hypothetical protein